MDEFTALTWARGQYYYHFVMGNISSEPRDLGHPYGAKVDLMFLSPSHLIALCRPFVQETITINEERISNVRHAI